MSKKAFDANLHETYVNRLGNLLFSQGSAYSIDFGVPKMETKQAQVALPKIKTKSQAPFVRKDTQTMTPFQANVPFDLGWEPKPILRTHPKDTVTYTESSINREEKEKARRTRPRVIMSPAFALDDIDKEDVRNVIMKEMYSSNYMVANESVAEQKKSIVAPLPKIYGSTSPILLPDPGKLPKVEKEWRWQTLKWEGEQLRGPNMADQMFWKDYDLTKSCVACLETAQVRKMRRLKKLY